MVAKSLPVVISRRTFRPARACAHAPGIRGPKFDSAAVLFSVVERADVGSRTRLAAYDRQPRASKYSRRPDSPAPEPEFAPPIRATGRPFSYQPSHVHSHTFPSMSWSPIYVLLPPAHLVRLPATVPGVFHAIRPAGHSRAQPVLSPSASRPRRVLPLRLRRQPVTLARHAAEGHALAVEALARPPLHPSSS